jgi:hypothetical protein
MSLQDNNDAAVVDYQFYYHVSHFPNHITALQLAARGTVTVQACQTE